MIKGFQMYVVRNDLSIFATIRSNIGAANEKVRRSDLTAYETADGVAESLPFTVSLDEFNLEYYKGTSAPMDYISIQDGEKISDAVASMNNIHKYKGYRFYQSGFDRDGNGATLAVSYDPLGIGITYTGYIALLVSMLGFFCQKGSRFRQLLKHPSLKKAMLVFLISGSFSGISQAAEPHPRLPERPRYIFRGEFPAWRASQLCLIPNAIIFSRIKQYPFGVDGINQLLDSRSSRGRR